MWSVTGNFDGYEMARSIKAASLHRLSGVTGGGGPLAEPYDIGSAAFWNTIQNDVDSLIGSTIKPSGLSAPPAYDGSGNVIVPVYTTAEIRAGLAQALDGSGAAVHDWNRERYRAFLGLADTTDTEGNTVADGMRAVRVVSGSRSGEWYRYDGATSQWVRDQAGGPPDVLASYNARPNWVPSGKAGATDILGRTIYTELYTVLDRIRWVAGPKDDGFKYRSRKGDAPTSSTYATAAAAQADSDASWTAATINNPSLWSVEAYAITSNSGTWYGASIFNEWIEGLTTTVGAVPRDVEIWTVARIGADGGDPVAFNGLGHDFSDDVWQHHTAFDVPGAAQDPPAEINLGDFPNTGTKPTPYPPEAANSSSIYSYRVKSLLVVHKLDIAGGSEYYT